jgi:hypothetical protein
MAGLDLNRQELLLTCYWLTVDFLLTDFVCGGCRQYKNPSMEVTPCVYWYKALLSTLSKTRDLSFVCDLHGHSKKFDSFMYGCKNKEVCDDCGLLLFVACLHFMFCLYQSFCSLCIFLYQCVVLPVSTHVTVGSVPSCLCLLM